MAVHYWLIRRTRALGLIVGPRSTQSWRNAGEVVPSWPVSTKPPRLQARRVARRVGRTGPPTRSVSQRWASRRDARAVGTTQPSNAGIPHRLLGGPYTATRGIRLHAMFPKSLTSSIAIGRNRATPPWKLRFAGYVVLSSNRGRVEQRPRFKKYPEFSLMSVYRRLFIPGGTYFFTVVTYDRRPILADPLGRQGQRAL